MNTEPNNKVNELLQTFFEKKLKYIGLKEIPIHLGDNISIELFKEFFINDIEKELNNDGFFNVYENNHTIYNHFLFIAKNRWINDLKILLSSKESYKESFFQKINISIEKLISSTSNNNIKLQTDEHFLFILKELCIFIEEHKNSLKSKKLLSELNKKQFKLDCLIYQIKMERNELSEKDVKDFFNLTQNNSKLSKKYFKLFSKLFQLNELEMYRYVNSLMLVKHSDKNNMIQFSEINEKVEKTLKEKNNLTLDEMKFYFFEESMLNVVTDGELKNRVFFKIKKDTFLPLALEFIFPKNSNEDFDEINFKYEYTTKTFLMNFLENDSNNPLDLSKIIDYFNEKKLSPLKLNHLLLLITDKNKDNIEFIINKCIEKTLNENNENPDIIEFLKSIPKNSIKLNDELFEKIFKHPQFSILLSSNNIRRNGTLNFFNENSLEQQRVFFNYLLVENKKEYLDDYAFSDFDFYQNFCDSIQNSDINNSDVTKLKLKLIKTKGCNFSILTTKELINKYDSEDELLQELNKRTRTTYLKIEDLYLLEEKYSGISKKINTKLAFDINELSNQKTLEIIKNSSYSIFENYFGHFLFKKKDNSIMNEQENELFFKENFNTIFENISNTDKIYFSMMLLQNKKLNSLTEEILKTMLFNHLEKMLNNNPENFKILLEKTLFNFTYWLDKDNTNDLENMKKLYFLFNKEQKEKLFSIEYNNENNCQFAFSFMKKIIGDKNTRLDFIKILSSLDNINPNFIEELFSFYNNNFLEKDDVSKEEFDVIFTVLLPKRYEQLKETENTHDTLIVFNTLSFNFLKEFNKINPEWIVDKDSFFYSKDTALVMSLKNYHSMFYNDDSIKEPILNKDYFIEPLKEIVMDNSNEQIYILSSYQESGEALNGNSFIDSLAFYNNKELLVAALKNHPILEHKLKENILFDNLNVFNGDLTLTFELLKETFSPFLLLEEDRFYKFYKTYVDYMQQTDELSKTKKNFANFERLKNTIKLFENVFSDLKEFVLNNKDFIDYKNSLFDYLNNNEIDNFKYNDTFNVYFRFLPKKEQLLLTNHFGKITNKNIFKHLDYKELADSVILSEKDLKEFFSYNSPSKRYNNSTYSELYSFLRSNNKNDIFFCNYYYNYDRLSFYDSFESVIHSELKKYKKDILNFSFKTDNGENNTENYLFSEFKNILDTIGTSEKNSIVLLETKDDFKDFIKGMYSYGTKMDSLAKRNRIDRLLHTIINEFISHSEDNIATEINGNPVFKERLISIYSAMAELINDNETNTVLKHTLLKMFSSSIKNLDDTIKENLNLETIITDLKFKTIILSDVLETHEKQLENGTIFDREKKDLKLVEDFKDLSYIDSLNFKTLDENVFKMFMLKKEPELDTYIENYIHSHFSYEKNSDVVLNYEQSLANYLRLKNSITDETVLKELESEIETFEKQYSQKIKLLHKDVGVKATILALSLVDKLLDDTEFNLKELPLEFLENNTTFELLDIIYKKDKKDMTQDDYNYLNSISSNKTFLTGMFFKQDIDNSVLLDSLDSYEKIMNFDMQRYFKSKRYFLEKNNINLDNEEDKNTLHILLKLSDYNIANIQKILKSIKSILFNDLHYLNLKKIENNFDDFINAFEPLHHYISNHFEDYSNFMNLFLDNIDVIKKELKVDLNNLTKKDISDVLDYIMYKDSNLDDKEMYADVGVYSQSSASVSSFYTGKANFTSDAVETLIEISDNLKEYENDDFTTMFPMIKQLYKNKDGEYYCGEIIPAIDRRTYGQGYATCSCLTPDGVSSDILEDMAEYPKRYSTVLISKMFPQKKESKTIDVTMKQLGQLIDEYNKLLISNNNVLDNGLKEKYTEIKKIIKENFYVAGAGASWIKGNQATVDNMETNTKKMVKDKDGKEIRINTTDNDIISFLQTSADAIILHSLKGYLLTLKDELENKKAIFKDKPLYVTIGSGYSDISLTKINKSKFSENECRTYFEENSEVYTDAKRKQQHFINVWEHYTFSDNVKGLKNYLTPLRKKGLEVVLAEIKKIDKQLLELTKSQLEQPASKEKKKEKKKEIEKK